MWARNLLFIGLVGAGVTALMGSLFPPRIAPRTAAATANDLPSPDYQNVVDEVNESFQEQWSAAGVTPAKPAPDLAVARRLSLALTGTIPSLEEIRRLEADPSSRRLDRFLAAMLTDRRHADYLAERLAQAYVGTEGGPFLVYRRRRFVSWLSDELLRHRPYDQLVRDMIASKGLWTDKPATNFVTVTMDAETKAPNPERLAARVARVFLGVRLDCAQCHDHPFQPWKKADFQGLAAYFGQVHSGFTGLYDGGGEFLAAKRKTGPPEAIPPRFPFCAFPFAPNSLRRTASAGSNWPIGLRTRKIPPWPAPRSTAFGGCCSAGPWSRRWTTSPVGASRRACWKSWPRILPATVTTCSAWSA
jgi:hypothetical protein